MARKEQVTITLDRELTQRLREIAQRRNSSLSSVIESYLRSSDGLSGKTDIQRVLDILGDIQEVLVQKELEEDAQNLDASGIQAPKL